MAAKRAAIAARLLHFSLAVDETPDRCNREVFSMVARTVFNGVLEEHLLAVEFMKKSDASALAAAIVHALAAVGVDASNVKSPSSAHRQAE